MADIDIHALLLKQEAKAKEELERCRSARRFEKLVEQAEERYATARAVRLNWEALEQKASPENQSGNHKLASLYADTDGTVQVTCSCGKTVTFTREDLERKKPC